MKLLLDTCVLAEFAKPTSIAPGVRTLVERHSSDALFISVVSLGEISKGIHLLPTSKRKAHLQHWMETLENEYHARLLSIDSLVADLWGELTAKTQQKGLTLPAADGLIAATAITYGLHLVTRNVDDFKHTPVLLVNPWDV
jgi:predicted nucleic acid-binding protein